MRSLINSLRSNWHWNKKVYDEGPNIVVIGGGSGLDSVLKGLKNYTSNLTAIVTVSDYGEGQTNSRRELGMLPLDDIKDSMIAFLKANTSFTPDPDGLKKCSAKVRITAGGKEQRSSR